ncbi:radical SAM protein [Nocardia sp. NPDC003482]
MTSTTTLEAAHRFLLADPGSAARWQTVLAHAPTDPTFRTALACHLAAPHTPARALAAATGCDLDAVREVYRFARHDPAVARLVTSWFYPHRMRWAFAATTVEEWRRRPDVPATIAAGRPVLGDTMEIHPTRGTCNYRCRMCLWSDQQTLTYSTRRLDTTGLLHTADWLRVLAELRDNGVRRLVVSGGGEALINPDLPAILNHAADLGFEIHVYTTGFPIRPRTGLFEALLRCHRIRMSIHSPDSGTYDRIAGTRPAQRALDRVARNLAALRGQRDLSPAVGIGFVIQPFNHDQILPMVGFAEASGADWLDLRKDEVDVTEPLTTTQLAVVVDQLRTIRATHPNTPLRIDIGDELVALANGVPADRSRTSECLGRYFRPTIGPYGHLTPCDLKAEPRFAHTEYTLGKVKQLPLLTVVQTSSGRRISDDCAQCMPSSRTGNKILHKLLDDLAAGVGLDEQPF